MSEHAGLSKRGRWTVTPEALTLDRRVSDRAHRLWCRLDRYAGRSEVAFPSHETLMQAMDCSRSSIIRAIKELVDTGWLEVERRSGRSNLYTVVDVNPTSTPTHVTSDTRVTSDMTSHSTGDTHKESSLEGTVLSPDAAVSPSVEGDQQPSSNSPLPVAESSANLTSSSGDETTRATGVVLDVPAFPHYEQETLTSWFNVTDGEPWVRAWNVVNATPTAVEYNPQVHLNSYLIRCKEQRQRPRADLWMRWFIEDREKYARSLAADEERQQNHLDPQEREERDNRRLPPADWGVPTTEGEA